MQMKRKKLRLEYYLNELQAKGRYTFTRQEALTDFGIGSADAFRFAALRLIKKRRLVRPKQGFYVIVPTEYMQVGAPPATWFIDALMKFYRQPYYVGLLSAAELYGAAHQAPQVFQVVTNRPLRKILVGRLQIEFFTKKQITVIQHKSVKTPTGYMQISFPEITAFDLVRYIKSAGYLSHVATVLIELQENFDRKRFETILKTENLELPYLQRLGYLIEFVRAKPQIVSLLKSWLKEKKPRLIPLRSDKGYDQKQKNNDWHLYINEKIETDI